MPPCAGGTYVKNPRAMRRIPRERNLDRCDARRVSACAGGLDIALKDVRRRSALCGQRHFRVRTPTVRTFTRYGGDGYESRARGSAKRRVVFTATTFCCVSSHNESAWNAPP